MRAQNPFHEDLFKRVRDMFPNPKIPRRLPKIPRESLSRDHDAIEQRRLTFLPSLKILSWAVPVLRLWRGEGSALDGLRSRTGREILAAGAEGRKQLAMAYGKGPLSERANDSIVDLFSSTIAAACHQVRDHPMLREEVRLLEHPNLGIFSKGEGVSVVEYMYFVASVGVRIMSTLVLQAFEFTEGSLQRAISVARRSEPLVLLGAAMAAQSANSLFGMTGGGLDNPSMRGLLRREDMELVEYQGLGEIVRLRREVVAALVIGLGRSFGGSTPKVRPSERFGCVALRVRVGELNLVQFVYRWILDALLEAKS